MFYCSCEDFPSAERAYHKGVGVSYMYDRDMWLKIIQLHYGAYMNIIGSMSIIGLWFRMNASSTCHRMCWQRNLMEHINVGPHVWPNTIVQSLIWFGVFCLFLMSVSAAACLTLVWVRLHTAHLFWVSYFVSELCVARDCTFTATCVMGKVMTLCLRCVNADRLAPE